MDKTTDKPQTWDQFVWDIAGNKVAIYITGIADFDAWDVQCEPEPTTCTHYVVMIQRDGEPMHTEHDTIHEARHVFMTAVNNVIVEFNS